MHNDHCWGLNVWYLTNGIITGCFTSNDKLYIIYLQIHDPQLAEAVLTSVYRHMWYLTEELVVLALADSDTSDDEKSHMVAQMAAIGRPQQFLPRKPAMKPDNRLVPSCTSSLEKDHGCSFIFSTLMSHGWLILHTSGINMMDSAASAPTLRTWMSWMMLPREQWKMSQNLPIIARIQTAGMMSSKWLTATGNW